METEKLGKNAKALMICEIINSVIDLFLSTFLVAYLLNITNENIGYIAIYYIIDYAITAISMYILGFFLKKYNIANIYRIGIFLKCVFVIIIVFLKQNIQNYIVPIAFILGVSETAYWGPCDNLVGYVTNNKNRTKYTANKKIIRSIVKIVMPLILGTSIELLSFYKVSGFVMFLAIIQVIISLQIKIKNENKEKFNLKIFLKSIKNNQKNRRLKVIYKAAILYGVLLNIIPTLITIIIIMTFKTNFQLGVLNTIFSICSMLSVYIFKKYYNKKKIKKILIICGLLSVISVISLLINIGKIEVILYNFVSSIFIIILEVIFNIERFNNFDNGIEEKYIIENQTFINIIMQAGRIIGYSLLLIASILDNIIYFKCILLLSTICIPVYSIYMYQLQKR